MRWVLLIHTEDALQLMLPLVLVILYLQPHSPAPGAQMSQPNASATDMCLLTSRIYMYSISANA